VHGKYREASKEARLTNQNARLAEEELEKLRLAQSQAHDATNRPAQVCHRSLQCTSAWVLLVCELLLHQVKVQGIGSRMLLLCMNAVYLYACCAHLSILFADTCGAYSQWYVQATLMLYLTSYAFACVQLREEAARAQQQFGQLDNNKNDAARAAEAARQREAQAAQLAQCAPAVTARPLCSNACMRLRADTLRYSISA